MVEPKIYLLSSPEELLDGPEQGNALSLFLYLTTLKSKNVSHDFL